MTRRTQGLTLFALLGIWTGVAFWVMAGAPEPQRVPLKYVTGKTARPEAGRTSVGTGLQVHLDLLAAARRQVEAAFVTPKNIFAPLPTEKTVSSVAKRRVPPLSPVPAPVPAPVPPVAAPAAPPPPSPEELAAQAARQELARFRYLGYLSRDGRDQAFLSKGKELYIVRNDETIEQTVLVKTVMPSSVILRETRTQVERTVPLVEGK